MFGNFFCSPDRSPPRNPSPVARQSNEKKRPKFRICHGVEDKKWSPVAVVERRPPRTSPPITSSLVVAGSSSSAFRCGFSAKTSNVVGAFSTTIPENPAQGNEIDDNFDLDEFLLQQKPCATGGAWLSGDKNEISCGSTSSGISGPLTNGLPSLSAVSQPATQPYQSTPAANSQPPHLPPPTNWQTVQTPQGPMTMAILPDFNALTPFLAPTSTGLGAIAAAAALNLAICRENTGDDSGGVFKKMHNNFVVKNSQNDVSVKKAQGKKRKTSDAKPAFNPATLFQDPSKRLLDTINSVAGSFSPTGVNDSTNFGRTTLNNGFWNEAKNVVVNTNDFTPRFRPNIGTENVGKSPVVVYRDCVISSGAGRSVNTAVVASQPAVGRNGPAVPLPANRTTIQLSLDDQKKISWLTEQLTRILNGKTAHELTDATKSIVEQLEQQRRAILHNALVAQQLPISGANCSPMVRPQQSGSEARFNFLESAANKGAVSFSGFPLQPSPPVFSGQIVQINGLPYLAIPSSTPSHCPLPHTNAPGAGGARSTFPQVIQTFSNCLPTFATAPQVSINKPQIAPQAVLECSPVDPTLNMGLTPVIISSQKPALASQNLANFENGNAITARIHQKLESDVSALISAGSNSNLPFRDKMDAIERLLPYHVHYEPPVDSKIFDLFDTLYKKKMDEIPEKTTLLTNRLRALLLREASKCVPTNEENMISRLWVENEKELLEQSKLELQRTIEINQKLDLEAADRRINSVFASVISSDSKSQPINSGQSIIAADSEVLAEKILQASNHGTKCVEKDQVDTHGSKSVVEPPRLPCVDHSATIDECIETVRVRVLLLCKNSDDNYCKPVHKTYVDSRQAIRPNQENPNESGSRAIVSVDEPNNEKSQHSDQAGYLNSGDHNNFITISLSDSTNHSSASILPKTTQVCNVVDNFRQNLSQTCMQLLENLNTSAVCENHAKGGTVADLPAPCSSNMQIQECSVNLTKLEDDLNTNSTMDRRSVTSSIDFSSVGTSSTDLSSANTPDPSLPLGSPSPGTMPNDKPCYDFKDVDQTSNNSGLQKSMLNDRLDGASSVCSFDENLRSTASDSSAFDSDEESENLVANQSADTIFSIQPKIFVREMSPELHPVALVDFEAPKLVLTINKKRNLPAQTIYSKSDDNNFFTDSSVLPKKVPPLKIRLNNKRPCAATLHQPQATELRTMGLESSDEDENEFVEYGANFNATNLRVDLNSNLNRKWRNSVSSSGVTSIGAESNLASPPAIWQK